MYRTFSRSSQERLVAYRVAVVRIQDTTILLPGNNHVTAVPHAFPEGQRSSVGAINTLGQLPLGTSEPDMQILHKIEYSPPLQGLCKSAQARFGSAKRHIPSSA